MCLLEDSEVIQMTEIQENALEMNGNNYEDLKFTRLSFKGGNDIDTMLASIAGTLDTSDITKVMPYKDAYGTILLFKYSKESPDVYEMMRFIKDDLQNFVPKDGNSDLRSFSKTQINCLQNFIKLMKSPDITSPEICKSVYDAINKTFDLFAHERFNIQEAKLFSMCHELVEKRLNEQKKEYQSANK